MASWIKKKIKDGDLIWFEYEEFSNKEEIGKGGFGIVYKADWNFRGMDKAALKILTNNGSSIGAKKIEEFIKELKFIRSFNYHPNINHFAGVTKDEKGNYVMVLQYANEGNLRQYLGNKERFDSLEWKDKIKMALDITKGLKCLHDKGIIHRDLHSKNILVNGNNENRTLMIADFGLSKMLTEKPSADSKQGIGMLEYTDPMFFKSNNSNFTRDKKSDIYSLGILLWEITSGHPPYQDIDQRFLSFKIGIESLREKPIKSTPSNYSDLYKKCWNDDPRQRPDIDEVYNILIQLQHPKKRVEEARLPHDGSNSTSFGSLVINFFKLNLNDNIINENELNKALKEIKEGYIKNNDTGPTKLFDFEHILKKHKPQSNHIFNHLENNPNTQHYEVLVGIFYKKGFGREKDENKAFKLFNEASQKGDVNGHFELGKCYCNVNGTEKDYNKALKSYHLAADEGLNIALHNLARYYHKCCDNNIKDKSKMAFKFYKKAANKGFVPSQYYLAKCYNIGMNGKKKDGGKALDWYKKYQENGGLWEISDEIKKVENLTITKSNIFKRSHSNGSSGDKDVNEIEALKEIVESYLRNNNSGPTKNFDFKYTLEKYESQSRQLFNRLKDDVQKGSSDWECNNKVAVEVVIGTFYKEGFGTEKDEKEAFKFYNKASQKGDINGHFELGKCYYNGIGIEEDYKKTLESYQRAKKGLNIALYNLAEYYYVKDKSKAFKLYKEAAKKGFVQSQYDVAKFYYNGIGKKKNEVKALIWYKNYQENDGLWEISDEINGLED